MSLTPHSGDSEHWFLNSTLFLPLANSPKGAAPAPASTRLNLHRKLHSTRSLIGAAIIAVSPAAGVARAQIVLSPEVSIAVAVVEVPGASPLELAPYQAKAPAAGGHPVIGLSADKGQALFDDVAGMKDAKILCHPTLVSHAGQQGTVSSGQSVNLSGGTPPVFAGITIDLTPQVSPKARKITLAVSCRQGQVFNQGTTYATSALDGTAAIRDGQTLVLDGPAAGDPDKHILVFITPRLVDGVGKPLYPNPYP